MNLRQHFTNLGARILNRNKKPAASSVNASPPPYDEDQKKKDHEILLEACGLGPTATEKEISDAINASREGIRQLEIRYLGLPADATFQDIADALNVLNKVTPSAKAPKPSSPPTGTSGSLDMK